MLFGNFERILLPSFDIEMSRAFLQDTIDATTFPHVYLDFIASFTGNKPFYMRLLCDEIERLILSKKVPLGDYSGLIESALTGTVFKKTGIINQYFSSFFFETSDGKLLSKSAAVLIALSSENKKQNDIAKSSMLQVRDVSKILNKLIEMDIIVRNGSFYRFKDKLFSFWLQSVYLKRLLSFSIDESLGESAFRKDVVNKLAMFLHEFGKEFSFRIMELFGLFKNDVIQLNGRKHKFFSFGNVQKLEENFSNSTNILATSGKLKWLCTIKKEYVTENDIEDIIKNVKRKKRNTRINRNVLISLAGINENAYLRAKEAKFWIWDPESLNVLMEIYGKPGIT
jgi:hypothetical protein